MKKKIIKHEKNNLDDALQFNDNAIYCRAKTQNDI